MTERPKASVLTLSLWGQAAQLGTGHAWAEEGEARSGGVGGEPRDHREGGEGARPPVPTPGAPRSGERGRSTDSDLSAAVQRIASRIGRAPRQAGAGNTPWQNTTEQKERGAAASGGGLAGGFLPPAGGPGGPPGQGDGEDARKGVEQNTTAGQPPRPIGGVGGGGRLLAARVDGLTVAYRVELDRKVYDLLELTRDHAALCSGKICGFEVWGLPFAVSGQPARHGGIRLLNADATIVVVDAQQRDEHGNVAGPAWTVEVTLRATYLATHTQAEIAAYARALAAFWADGPKAVLAERVRRVDLAADVELSEGFSTDDRAGFVMRSKNVTDYAPELPIGLEEHDAEAVAIRAHWKPGSGETRLTGFTFSPGCDLMARLYDKRQELKNCGPSDEKVSIENALWARGGYAGGEVWRLEFQVKRPVLEQVKFRDERGRTRHGINTLDDLWPNLDAIWAYASRAWLRLTDPDSATRRERARLDERWLTYQAARFGSGEIRIVKRERAKRGGPEAAQALGTVQSFLASLGKDADVYDRTKIDPETGRFAFKDPEVLLKENLERFAELCQGLGARYVESCVANHARYASADDDALPAEPERKAG